MTGRPAGHDGRVTDRLVTPATLGAWLVKCNADHSDVTGWTEHHRIQRWCVRPGYRTALMAPGHRVVLWVGGSRARLARGVWGVGHLTGPARWDQGKPGAEPRWYVPLELSLLAPGDRVGREQLRADPRLAGLEVFRQPQAANPSYLTTAQAAALEDHVSWPAPGGS